MTSKLPLKLKQRGHNAPLFFQCAPVADYDEARPVILQMLKLCLARGYEGMSANQLGVPLQVFVTNMPFDGPRVYINPRVQFVGKASILQKELCGSRPKKTAERLRHPTVIVEACHLNGRPFYLNTNDVSDNLAEQHAFAARIQHEIEHLSGVDPQRGLDA